MNWALARTCAKNKSRSTSCRPFMVVVVRVPPLRVVAQFRTSCSCASEELANKANSKSLYKALRSLELVNPKSSLSTQRHADHLRLLQSCMQDLLEKRDGKSSTSVNLAERKTHDSFDEILDSGAECWALALYKEKDVLSLFSRMHKKGLRVVGANAFSCALSVCGASKALGVGIQLHSLATKTGFVMNVYVGSSLVTLYGKCWRLDDAYRMFEGMPVRNVVSWTAIIASFAQHCQVEMCLWLYHEMRHLTIKPNDITLMSLLTACMGGGSLGKGRSAHCQTIKMGFHSYTHIGNALVSMYSKCGNIGEAFYIFENMQGRDLISWNSMIAGFAQHGLAEKAIDLLKEMVKQKIKPDAITFLGVLSSCRHEGLVEKGRTYFNSMIELGLTPDLDHYSCIVDLLGRAGLLEDAQEFVQKMPILPNAVIWGSLLSSSRLHGNVWIGIHAAESRLLLEPGCAATHVQLANLYASVGCWDQAARVRKLMKDRRLKTNPGYSWVEIGGETHRFMAEDRSNTKVNEILTVVDGLVYNMRGLGYSPKIQEEEVEL
nr:TPA_asm: hypothetical protein HUJ06_029247 [Nelumbo nucifera]